ncbi:hypothetical protein R3P38DRAFT_3627591 [Favolaschia claudopus]|uniref:Uncharacterized protein n=1 Tax=Favolaschia claudopus TaxID=2862362 RepID=A0AAV9ZZL8_9AGAR
MSGNDGEALIGLVLVCRAAYCKKYRTQTGFQKIFYVDVFQVRHRAEQGIQQFNVVQFVSVAKHRFLEFAEQNMDLFGGFDDGANLLKKNETKTTSIEIESQQSKIRDIEHELVDIGGVSKHRRSRVLGSSAFSKSNIALSGNRPQEPESRFSSEVLVTCSTGLSRRLSSLQRSHRLVFKLSVCRDGFVVEVGLVKRDTARWSNVGVGVGIKDQCGIRITLDFSTMYAPRGYEGLRKLEVEKTLKNGLSRRMANAGFEPIGGSEDAAKAPSRSSTQPLCYSIGEDRVEKRLPVLRRRERMESHLEDPEKQRRDERSSGREWADGHSGPARCRPNESRNVARACGGDWEEKPAMVKTNHRGSRRREGRRGVHA